MVTFIYIPSFNHISNASVLRQTILQLYQIFVIDSDKRESRILQRVSRFFCKQRLLFLHLPESKFLCFHFSSGQIASRDLTVTRVEPRPCLLQIMCCIKKESKMITSTTVLIDMIVLVGVSPFGPGCTIIEKNHVSRTYYSIFRVNKGYFFYLIHSPNCRLPSRRKSTKIRYPSRSYTSLSHSYSYVKPAHQLVLKANVMTSQVNYITAISSYDSNILFMFLRIH